MKKRHLPRQKPSENAEEGIPNILLVTRTEPLNSPLTVKLWSSIAEYIDKHGGPDFVRAAILEKLQRIVDKPCPAICSQCTNLTRQDGEPFCLWLCAYFLPEDKKLLDKPFSCSGFQPRKESK